MAQISTPLEVKQYRYEPVLERTVSVLRQSARQMHTVVQVDGHRDDDFHQGEYHDVCIVEAYDDESVAVTRADQLNAEDGFESSNSSGGWETYVYSYRLYRVGTAVMHLCVLDERLGEKQKDR